MHPPVMKCVVNAAETMYYGRRPDIIIDGGHIIIDFYASDFLEMSEFYVDI
jgi:hypothetical protein